MAEWLWRGPWLQKENETKNIRADSVYSDSSFRLRRRLSLSILVGSARVGSNPTLVIFALCFDLDIMLFGSQIRYPGLKAESHDDLFPRLAALRQRCAKGNTLVTAHFGDADDKIVESANMT